MAAAHLEKLNDRQREAVEHGIGLPEGQIGGPLLVIAGAGSGKTNTLAHRVAHLIVNGSYSAPRLASATARKYGLSRSQLNTWRRAYREGQLAIGNFDGFVPALVVAEAPVPAPVPLNSPSGAGRMEILSANGRRVIVDRDVDVDVLVRILRGLETLE